MTAPPEWIALLVAALLRPMLLAAAAVLLLRLARLRHPAAEHNVWAVVLAGMLLLPPLAAVGPHWSWPGPKPMGAAAIAASPRHQATNPTLRRISGAAVFLTAPPAASIESLPNPAPGAHRRLPSLPAVVLMVYFAGLAAMLAYRACGWYLLRRLIFRSRPVHGERLRESHDVLTPVAVGLLLPAVILPANWRRWDGATKRAVMAHELAHLRRRDAWVAALAGAVKCIYWFHPLSWWLVRQVNATADLACDAAALTRSGDATQYARILLRFAAEARRAGLRAVVPGVAMATRAGIESRIDRLFSLPADAAPRRRLAIALLPLFCLLSIGLRPLANPQPRGLPDSPVLHFQVASIKPAHGTTEWTGVYQNGRFTEHAIPLEELIYEAFPAIGADLHTVARLNLDYERNTFDVDALAPPDSSKAEMQRMLQTLLVERFHLAIHRETHAMPGYFLEVAPGGAHITPASALEAEANPFSQCVRTAGADAGDGAERCNAITISAVANMMPNWATGYVHGRPVIDRTGLTGVYSFAVRWRYLAKIRHPGERGFDPAVDFTFFDALERQLGLRLTAAMVEVPTYVVDSADEQPAPDPPGTVLPTAPLSFTTESFRPAAKDSKPFSNVFDDGRVEFRNLSLQSFIEEAWGGDGVIDELPAIGPDSITGAHYDLDARLAPGGSYMLALRDLLERRFQIRAHTETRPVPGWALVQDSTGARLKPSHAPPSAADCDLTRPQGFHRSYETNCVRASAADFAGWLSGNGGTSQYLRETDSVLDKTGLHGVYDISFTLPVRPLPKAAAGQARPIPSADVAPVREALRQQLGLNLVPATTSRRVIVVDQLVNVP